MSKVERRMVDSGTNWWGRAAVLPAGLPQLLMLFLMLLLVLLLAPASPAVAQDTVPRIEDAELVFDQAVQAFEEGDFGMAYRRFRLLYDTYALNRKTTAAYLMAGKSLYRSGQYREAADLLTAFIRRFPTSSYIGEAQRTLDFALQQMELAEGRRETIDLGVLLPLGGEPLLVGPEHLETLLGTVTEALAGSYVSYAYKDAFAFLIISLTFGLFVWLMYEAIVNKDDRAYCRVEAFFPWLGLLAFSILGIVVGGWAEATWQLPRNSLFGRLATKAGGGVAFFVVATAVDHVAPWRSVTWISSAYVPAAT